MISDVKSLNKVWKEKKRLKTAEKVFRPAFRCALHPKAGRNTQQITIKYREYRANILSFLKYFLNSPTDFPEVTKEQSIKS